MKKVHFTQIAFLILLSFTLIGRASASEGHDHMSGHSHDHMMTHSHDHINDAATKLTRGVVNVTTSWMEVPKQIHLTSHEYDPLVGLTYGTVKGVAFTAMRATSGAFDVGTFIVPSPQINNMQPEFVFDSWES